MEYWVNVAEGRRSRDFIDGVKMGVEAFAFWKGGRQLVGVLQVPLEDVFRDIERQLGGDSNAKGS